MRKLDNNECLSNLQLLVLVDGRHKKCILKRMGRNTQRYSRLSSRLSPLVTNFLHWKLLGLFCNKISFVQKEQTTVKIDFSLEQLPSVFVPYAALLKHHGNRIHIDTFCDRSGNQYNRSACDSRN